MSAEISSTPRKLSILSLDENQELAVDRLFEHDQTLLIAEPGSGKTAIVLEAVRELIGREVLKNVLVVAPLRVAQLTWPEEAAKWAPELTVAVAVGPENKRLIALAECADITVVNFEMLPWLAKELDIGATFDGLVIDESTRLASVSTGPVRGLRRYRFAWSCLLSGTPVLEGLEGLYSQMLILDGGVRLGTRKEKYMRAFFTPDWTGRVWTAKPGAAGALAATVRDVVHTVPSYSGELPELKIEPIVREMPATSYDGYRQLERDGVWEGVVCASEAVKSAKLAQYASGVVYMGEAGAIEETVVHSVKLDLLDQILAERTEPLMIIYQWLWQMEWLKRAGIPILGSQKDIVARWNRGEVPVLAAHPRACSHGLNLQAGGCDQLWLQPIWSADQWWQTVRRLWRRGQQRAVRVRVLVSARTVDEEIMDRIELKQTNARAFDVALEM